MNSVNYDDAVIHRDHLRNQPPAIYNNVRPRERPIPNIDSDDEEEIAVQNIIQDGTGIIHNDYQIPIGQNDEDGNQSNVACDWEDNFDLNLEQVSAQNDNSWLDGDNSVEIKEEIWDPIAITEADAAELSPRCFTLSSLFTLRRTSIFGELTMNFKVFFIQVIALESPSVDIPAT